MFAIKHNESNVCKRCLLRVYTQTTKNLYTENTSTGDDGGHEV
jgi:hypothetical protein